MSRADEWVARQEEGVQVDRPRFESQYIEACVTDDGNMQVWVTGTIQRNIPPDTALAFADWCIDTFGAEVDASSDPMWDIH